LVHDRHALFLDSLDFGCERCPFFISAIFAIACEFVEFFQLTSRPWDQSVLLNVFVPLAGLQNVSDRHLGYIWVEVKIDLAQIGVACEDLL